MSPQEFDLLFARVEKAYPDAERERLSKRPRRRAIGTGRRFALDLRNRVLLLLFYYRTYATQDVVAEIFGVGQATVSRSIDRMAPLVRQYIPIPVKLHDRAKRVSTIEELEEILPGLRCLIDASEQQVQRPKRKDMKKSHYSGKAGRYTAKVQYTVNTNGLITHNTRTPRGASTTPGRAGESTRRFPAACRPGTGRWGAEADPRCGFMRIADTGGRRTCTGTWRYCSQSAERLEKSSRRSKRSSTRRARRSVSAWSMRSAGSRLGGSWGARTGTH